MIGPLGMQEMLIIMGVALIVFGPRKLPQIGKTLGRSLAEFRRTSTELRNTLEREVEMEDFRSAREEVTAAGKDFRAGLDPDAGARRPTQPSGPGGSPRPSPTKPAAPGETAEAEGSAPPADGAGARSGAAETGTAAGQTEEPEAVPGDGESSGKDDGASECPDGEASAKEGPTEGKSSG